MLTARGYGDGVIHSGPDHSEFACAAEIPAIRASLPQAWLLSYVHVMLELKIVLRGAAAEKLKKLIADEHYAHPEDAVEEALDALAASRDPALDAWLRTAIAGRAAALAADPARGRTPDQVRERLRDPT